MKKFILILSGVLLLAGCKKGSEGTPGTPEEAAKQAISELTAATKELEDKTKKLTPELKPPSLYHFFNNILRLIAIVQSTIAKANEASMQKGVSENTKAAVKEAVEKANQAIASYDQRKSENDVHKMVESLTYNTDFLKSNTAALKAARTAAEIEEAIRQIRAFEDHLKYILENIPQAIKAINEENVREAIKDKANQAIGNANQAIANANQAIEAVLTPQAP